MINEQYDKPPGMYSGNRNPARAQVLDRAAALVFKEYQACEALIKAGDTNPELAAQLDHLEGILEDIYLP